MYAVIPSHEGVCCPIESETLDYLVAASGLFRFDMENGILYFKEMPDTITYRVDEFTREELREAMRDRAITMMRRIGWRFYTSI